MTVTARVTAPLARPRASPPPGCPLLRHTYVTTMPTPWTCEMSDRGAAADPRTTMRYDRARHNLDRHPNYILAAYMASGTWGDPAASQLRRPCR
jgi:hypothetical protein